MSSAGLLGLIAQARYVAQRRSQRFTTGHCVLTMLGQSEEVRAVLVRAGVSENALVSALKVEVDESPMLFERAAERASKLAAEAGVAVTPMHLLAAIAWRSRRTTGSGCSRRTRTTRC